MPATLPETEFLGGLTAANEDSQKTRIVRELMDTKKFPQDKVQMLGCAREESKFYYYFVVPGAVIEIEIFWDKNNGEYTRCFSNVFDEARQLQEMIGRVPS